MSTNGSAALARVEHQASPIAIAAAVQFTADQRQLILDTCCGGAPPGEARALVAIAEARGLNPLTGDCYFVQRWDGEKQRMVWAVQASIDSFRSKAEETGLYAGQDEPEFEYEEDGRGGRRLLLARVRVYRKDWPRPMVGVARYSEYVQKKKDGTPTKFWANMPHNQLAKCAESLAIRKCFPKVLAGIYTRDEMQQADTEPAHDPETGELREEPPAPQRPPSTPPPAGPGAAAADAARELAMQSAQSQFDLRRHELMQAPDVGSLKGVWAKVAADAKSTRITLEQRAQLAALKDARKVVFIEAEREAEIARAAADARAMEVGDDPGGLAGGRVVETASGRTTFSSNWPSDEEAPEK